MLLTILVIVLIVALIGGGFGHSRVGLVGWSPAGVVLLILAVLFLTGRIHF